MNALLLCGPRHGEILNLADSFAGEIFCVVVKKGEASIDLATYWSGEPVLTEDLSFTEVRYVRQALALFGKSLIVYAYDQATESQIQEAASRVLLTATAQGLAQEVTP